MGQIIDKYIFMPPNPTYLPHNFKNISKRNRRGNIPIIIYKEKENVNNFWTIVFSHGNSQDLGLIEPFLENLRYELKCNIVSYEYTGYGQNLGEPNEMDCYEDLEDVYYHLLDIGINKNKIILMGFSLGGAITTFLARKLLNNEGENLKEMNEQENKPLGGVILISNFATIGSIVSQYLDNYITSFNNLDNIQYIYNTPTLIIHSLNDELVPAQHSINLYNKLPSNSRSGLVLLDNCGHNSVLYDDKLVETIKMYLKEL